MGIIKKKEGYYEKAINYFKTSSKLGNGESQYEYAKMLYKGIGYNENKKEAFNYFSMTKNNGINKSNKYLNKLNQSEITFIVFTTLNYKSMIEGDEIKVDVGNDTINKLQEKIKEIFKSNYKRK